MIHRLSLEIADYLFYREVIDINKYDIYRYGFEMIISTIIGVILYPPTNLPPYPKKSK